MAQVLPTSSGIAGVLWVIIRRMLIMVWATYYACQNLAALSMSWRKPCG